MTATSSGVDWGCSECIGGRRWCVPRIQIASLMSRRGMGVLLAGVMNSRFQVPGSRVRLTGGACGACMYVRAWYQQLPKKQLPYNYSGFVNFISVR